MKARIVLAVALLIALVPGLYLLSYWYGRGARGFYSPDTLEVRSQSELLLPIVNIPLYRSAFTYRDEPYPLVQYLVEKGYWKPIKTDEPRWILMFHWNDQWRDGYGSMYTVMRDGQHWIEWSEAHPEIAAFLWPEVLRMLRDDDLYLCAEHVMWIAKCSKSVDEFYQSVANDIDLRNLGVTLRRPPKGNDLSAEAEGEVEAGNLPARPSGN